MSTQRGLRIGKVKIGTSRGLVELDKLDPAETGHLAKALGITFVGGDMALLKRICRERGEHPKDAKGKVLWMKWVPSETCICGQCPLPLADPSTDDLAAMMVGTGEWDLVLRSRSS
jgi:hypothetical protein